MDDDSLWIDWETFVQKHPKQLRDRGADRTTVLLVLLWINIALSSIGSYIYYKLPNSNIFPIGYTIGYIDQATFLKSINAIYIIIGFLFTVYILKLSKKNMLSGLIFQKNNQLILTLTSSNHRAHILPNYPIKSDISI